MLYYAYALCILFCSVLNEGGLFVLLCTIFALDWNVNSAVLFVKVKVKVLTVDHLKPTN